MAKMAIKSTKSFYCTVKKGCSYYFFNEKKGSQGYDKNPYLMFFIIYSYFHALKNVIIL